jgi:hypothetical protein
MNKKNEKKKRKSRIYLKTEFSKQKQRSIKFFFFFLIKTGLWFGFDAPKNVFTPKVKLPHQKFNKQYFAYWRTKIIVF